MIRLACALTLSVLVGCARGPNRRPDPPVESTLPDYWLKRPPVARASHGDFEDLWNACRRAVESRSFAIDRVDLRGGVMTTFPQVSKQLFEPWRNDVGFDFTVHGLDERATRNLFQSNFSVEALHFEIARYVADHDFSPEGTRDDDIRVARDRDVEVAAAAWSPASSG